MIIITFVLSIMICFILFYHIPDKTYEHYHDDTLDRMYVAGKSGEDYVLQLIQSVLVNDDYLLSNIEIIYRNRIVEIDHIVVNKNGIYIIEVKNYKGVLKGNINDAYLKKIRINKNHQTIIKNVRNPFIQLRYQIKALSTLFNQHDIQVLIKGYCYFVNNNCPFDTNRLLYDVKDIDKVLHTQSDNNLSKGEISSILSLLQYGEL